MASQGEPYVPRGSAILPIAMRRAGARDRDLCGSPELVLTIGRDRHSSGCSIFLRTPSGGEYPRSRLLLSERWNAPIPGEEGIVVIAIQALQSVLGEIRGIQEGAGQE